MTKNKNYIELKYCCHKKKIIHLF